MPAVDSASSQRSPPALLAALFELADRDGDGELDRDEFERLQHELTTNAVRI